MENCVLIPLKPSEKHAHKNWKKHLKKLILDGDLRKRLGEQLHEDFKELYNLKNVTEKRARLYSEVTEKIIEKKKQA
jgi:glycosyltransferase involved in cell wall biosynthesis